MFNGFEKKNIFISFRVLSINIYIYQLKFQFFFKWKYYKVSFSKMSGRFLYLRFHILWCFRLKKKQLQKFQKSTSFSCYSSEPLSCQSLAVIVTIFSMPAATRNCTNTNHVRFTNNIVSFRPLSHVFPLHVTKLYNHALRLLSNARLKR